MKMAKPSERDIDAAGNLMSLLHQLDSGDYPCLDENKEVPDWFDEDNFEHLRAFYDAVKSTLDQGSGYPGRVIGGMCYVIMYDKNEIIDPNSDTIDLHPKLVKALEAAEAKPLLADWISVDEAEPLEGELVAARYWPYDNHENPQAVTGMRYIDGTFFNDEGDEAHPPSHWCRLPAFDAAATAQASTAGGRQEGGQS